MTTILTSHLRGGGCLMRLSVVATCLCCCLIGFSAADDAHASIRKFTNIPAEGLGPALQMLARDRNFQIVFVSEELANVRTQGAIGEFTPEEALKRLLTGTGLTYKYLDDKTVTIVPASAAGSGQATTQNAASGSSDDASSSKEGKKGSSRDFRVAQVAQVDQGSAGPQTVGDDQNSDNKKKKEEGLSEIVVTGSRIPTVAGNEVQPVRSYTRADIESSGQTTIGDFLNTLPDVSINSNQAGYGTFAGQTSVQLHGLPLGTTLLLLNGRQVETSYFGFFDLNNIPVSAIERIEVLPVGSSAIYGSDALGGAVNIILRQNLSGLEVNAKAGSANGGASEKDADLAWGKSGDRGAISLIASYQNIGALLGRDRAVTSAVDFPANFPASSLFVTWDACNPGTVYSLNGQNLPGLSSTQAAIPGGLSGKPTIQAFQATAGQAHICNANLDAAFIPATERWSTMLSGHYEVGEQVDVFTETLFTHERKDNRSGDYLNGFSEYGTTLGAANPYNPFGETVGISFSYPGIETGYENTQTFIRPLIGVRGTFLADWHYEVTGFLSRNDFQAYNDSLPNAPEQAALDSSNPATALNPFTTGAPGTPQLLQSLQDAATVTNYRYINQLAGGQVVLRGTLFNLPAGPFQAVFGADYNREEQYSELGQGAPPLDLSRNTHGLFTEERIPLLAGGAQPRTDVVLALTLAGRYDDSSDFGSKTTWQGGLDWRPIDALQLRGSYATSYKAPQLQQISGGPSANFPIGGLIDPFMGNALVTVPVTFGSNFKLQPETGSSQTFGLVYSSGGLPGLKLSVTYFGIDIKNYITEPAVQTIIDNPSVFPGAVTRGPPSTQDIQQGFLGPITHVNDIFFNFGSLSVSGVDFDLRYKMDTAIGEVTPSIAVTNTYRWNAALTPNMPAVSYVSQASIVSPGFAPRWKGTAALGWNRGPYSLAVDARYIGRYRDYQDYVSNSNELGNFYFIDANFRFDAGASLAPHHRWLAGTYIAVGGVNLFNRLPQFAYTNPGFDLAESDIRGRFLYAQFGAKW